MTNEIPVSLQVSCSIFSSRLHKKTQWDVLIQHDEQKTEIDINQNVFWLWLWRHRSSPWIRPKQLSPGVWQPNNTRGENVRMKYYKSSITTGSLNTGLMLTKGWRALCDYHRLSRLTPCCPAYPSALLPPTHTHRQTHSAKKWAMLQDVTKSCPFSQQQLLKCTAVCYVMW